MTAVTTSRPLNIVCPECYAPLHTRKRKDGRCDECLSSKELLPVNYRRPPKKKSDDDEDESY